MHMIVKRKRQGSGQVEVEVREKSGGEIVRLYSLYGFTHVNTMTFRAIFTVFTPRCRNSTCVLYKGFALSVRI